MQFNVTERYTRTSRLFITELRTGRAWKFDCKNGPGKWAGPKSERAEQAEQS
jgi:hypothetical protein